MNCSKIDLVKEKANQQDEWELNSSYQIIFSLNRVCVMLSKNRISYGKKIKSMIEKVNGSFP